MKQIFTFSIFTFLVLLSFAGKAQTPTGLKDATSMASQAIFGTVSWSNPFNALFNDGTTTSVTALILGDDTDYLTATGFNIVVPPGMIVSGIEVEIVKSGTNGILYSVTDKDVRIIKGGVRTGNNKAVTGKWPSADQTFTYGSSSDDWGTTWTVADVQSANFGVAISAHLAGVLLPTASVNAIRVNVYYDSAPLPVALLNFEANTNANTVVLDWSTATEINNESFTVQHSVNGNQWNDVKVIPSQTTNSAVLRSYTFTDSNPSAGKNYYRLKQTDLDQQVTYSFIATAEVKTEELLVYPNPSNGIIHLVYSEQQNAKVPVVLSDIWGKTIQSYDWPSTGNDFTLTVSSLPAGDYLISMTLNEKVVNQRIRIAY